MVEIEYALSRSWGQEGKGDSGKGETEPLRLKRRARWLSSTILSTSILVLAAACAPAADRPPSPPVGLKEFLGVQDYEQVSTSPGLTYYGFENPSKPWMVHVLRVELDRCELGLEVLEAPAGAGVEDGRSTVSDLAGAAGGQILASVNGDFFNPEGRPVGTEVVWGEFRRISGRPAVAWRPGSDPWMGIPSARGDTMVQLGWELSRDLGDGGTQVIGGFPLLLADGGRVGDLEVSERPSFAAEPHPRTAVGFDSDENLLWILVVDGRQPDHSMGMTLPELASLMEALGVEEGINLDGGGSSVMILGGVAVSHPSDAQGERPVANALAVRNDSALCSLR